MVTSNWRKPDQWDNPANPATPTNRNYHRFMGKVGCSIADAVEARHAAQNAREDERYQRDAEVYVLLSTPERTWVVRA